MTGGVDVNSKWAFWPLALASVLLLLAAMGAAPQQQEERPPQPLYQDYYTGTVMVDGDAAPVGTHIIGCVDNCHTYVSDIVSVGEDGAYEDLVLGPDDLRMVGRTVTFYIINEHGALRARETREFIGIYDYYVLDLNFVGPIPAPPPPPTATPIPTRRPLPTPTLVPTATPEPTPEPTATPPPTPEPTPTAILPVTGDTAVRNIPPLAIVGGIALVALGAVLFYAGGRRVHRRLFPRT